MTVYNNFLLLHYIKQHAEKSFVKTYKIFINIIFFILQNLLKRASLFFHHGYTAGS